MYVPTYVPQKSLLTSAASNPISGMYPVHNVYFKTICRHKLVQMINLYNT